MSGALCPKAPVPKWKKFIEKEAEKQVELYDLIDQLEVELGGKPGLFGKKVDAGRCLAILDRIRQVLPNELGEAQFVVENKRKILENADTVAKNTIREAEERAEHIIDNTEIIKRAETEAKQILETAYMQCDTLVHHTKEHLDNTFRETEQFLLSTLTMIRNNREELRGAMITKPDNDRS